MTCAGCGQDIVLSADHWVATSAAARRAHIVIYCPATDSTWHEPEKVAQHS